MASFAKSAARFGGPLRTCLLALVTTASVLLLCSRAEGEEVFTSQAAAADATDTTWIPAPAQRAAVCIVDSGVDMNPDTTNVVARFAIDGGDPGDVSPDKHGTLMAMIASAPYNGFGMVGAAPSVNVVSVRALSADTNGFTLSAVAAAIQRCEDERLRQNVKVISLSLGVPYTATTDPVAEHVVEDAVDQANHAGLDVVAAAGNLGGAVEWPAAYGPVLAVGAAAPDGAPCSFASTGPEIDLWAPGCPQDVALPGGEPAWASGSSEATALTSAALAQLREFGQGLGPAAAETLLTSGGAPGPDGPELDVGRTYANAHLDSLVSEGRAARPVTPSDPTLPSPAAPASATSNPPAEPGVQPLIADAPRAPRIGRPRTPVTRYRRGVLTILLRARPTYAYAEVTGCVFSPHAFFPSCRRLRRLSPDRFRFPLSGRAREVTITYHDAHRLHSPSAPLIFRP